MNALLRTYTYIVWPDFVQKIYRKLKIKDVAKDTKAIKKQSLPLRNFGVNLDEGL